MPFKAHFSRDYSGKPELNLVTYLTYRSLRNCWSQEEYFKFQETRIIDQRIFLGGLIKVGRFYGIKTM